MTFRKTLCCISATFSLGIIPQAFAQTELVITPRAEVNFADVDGDTDTDFGMSSLYGFLDGTINENFSYSASFHFLSTDPKALYNYKAPFSDGTWIDWAYLSFDSEPYGVGIDLGKVVLNMGGFEFDKNDVDCYIPLVSDYWNSLCIYQPGITFRLYPSETQAIEAQLTTSPMKMDYSDIGLAASVAWRGEFGPFSTYWAANFQEYYKSIGDVICVGLGNKYSFENLDLILDLFYGPDELSGFNKSCCELSLRADYKTSDKLSFELMGGYRATDRITAGALVEYYPLGDDTLRFHLSASDRYLPDMSNAHNLYISLGLTANLHIGL